MKNEIIMDLMKSGEILMSDVNYIESFENHVLIISKNNQAVFIYEDDYMKDMVIGMRLKDFDIEVGEVKND